MAPAANSYLDLGWNDMSGLMQHTQHDGWFDSYNSYNWGPRDWTEYFDRLRNNEFLLQSGGTFHQGIALTIRAFQFGMITDLWGDAPYTEALKGTQGKWEPAFDSQEIIYRGIIDELQRAAAIFATGDNGGYLTGYDTYYGGDTQKWHKFANSLLLRYYLRISDKLPEIARQGIESVYSSGIYIKQPSEDATISFVGSAASNQWPYLYHLDEAGASSFRRKKPAQTLIDQFRSTNDPRLSVWFAPVHVQWIADPGLPVATEPFIRKNGAILNGVTSLEDRTLKAEIQEGARFTRHFNPVLYAAENNGAVLDTNLYVGIPVGIRLPDYHNGNPTPGQVVENQHVSQLSDVYRYANKPSVLKGRIIHSAETAFILAETALKGWNTGSAEEHYNNAIQLSLETWDVAGQYNSFINTPGVKYNGTLEQIITQKWIASWSASTESWMDYRRTGFPQLKAGPASPQPALPVRFIYGEAEAARNRENINKAIEALQQTQYATQKNNQWSKPWLLKDTGKPW